MGKGQNQAEKFEALHDQFEAHVDKYQRGCDSDNFYQSKKALNDMVTFHNEMVKIRDRFDRKGDSEIVNAMDERLQATRAVFASHRLRIYELSHREVL